MRARGVRATVSLVCVRACAGARLVFPPSSYRGRARRKMVRGGACVARWCCCACARAPAPSLPRRLASPRSAGARLARLHPPPCARALLAQTKRDYDHLFKLVLIGDSGVGKSCEDGRERGKEQTTNARA